MSNEFKRRFDERAAPRFRARGMADAATFQQGAAAPIPMAEVYVDDGVQVFGQESGVPTLVTTIRLFKRFGIPRPTKGARITVGDEAFVVDAITDQDSSSYVVIVTPGSA